jgi:hypothetical protein
MRSFERVSSALTGAAAVVASVASLGSVGCQSTKSDDAAMAQLLIRTAADRAVEQVDATPLRSKAVYLDGSSLDGGEKSYLLGSLRQKLAEGGVQIMSDAKDAEIILEPRAAVMAVDKIESSFGMPSVSVPVPMTPAVPELSFVKRVNQVAKAKLCLFARTRADGRHLFTAKPVMGTAYFTRINAGLDVTAETDLPEYAGSGGGMIDGALSTIGGMLNGHGNQPQPPVPGNPVSAPTPASAPAAK